MIFKVMLNDKRLAVETGAERLRVQFKQIVCRLLCQSPDARAVTCRNCYGTHPGFSLISAGLMLRARYAPNLAIDPANQGHQQDYQFAGPLTRRDQRGLNSSAV